MDSNNKKCPHGFYVDPITGKHIIPNNVAVPISEAATAFKQPPVVKVTRPPQTKLDKELQEGKKYWDKYYAENRGKIPADFPKTIFDNVSSTSSNSQTKVQNTVKQFKRLLESGY